MPQLRRATTEDLPALLESWCALYAEDPSRVVPPHAWTRRALTGALARPEHFVLFIATEHHTIVGSVSVQLDPTGPEDIAWFGHFEARDAEVAAELLAVAADIARGWNAVWLRGPRGLSRFEFVGLTVSGHDTPPPMLQGHHPPAFAAWVEAAGFHRHHDHLAYETALVDDSGQPRALPDALARKAESCTVAGLSFRRARRRHLDRDLIAAHTVLNEAYATVPDIRPMPRAQFLGLTRAILLLGHPELIQLGFVHDRPVAFAVCIPEVNEALAPAEGHLLPLGWARILRAWPRIHTAAFKLIGVLPELRGTGVHGALIRAVVEGAQRGGFTRMDGSIIDERNAPMRGVVEGAGMTVYRTYRVYERALSA
jgi:GNAT superfamily N-acetyltransferase